MSTVVQIVPTRHDLIVRQFEIWPDTVVRGWTELASILADDCAAGRGVTNMDGTPVDWHALFDRYFNEMPTAVPYSCGKQGQYRGIRFGLDGSQYISFF